MTDRRTSVADQETIVACRERGETGVTARKLERWRQAGCLPARDHVHVAGVPGSRSTNPDGYVDQVMAVATLMRSGIKLVEGPIALFADGYPVRLEKLKDSYSHFLTWLKRRLTEIAVKQMPEVHVAADIADAAARVLAQHVAGTVLAPWRQRARKMTKSSPAGEKTSGQQYLDGALSTLLTAVFAGEVPSSEGVGEALTVAGFNDGQDFDRAAEKMASSSLDRMTEAVHSASVDDFIAAREIVDGAYRYAAAQTRMGQALQPGGMSLPGLAEIGPDIPIARTLMVPYLLSFTAEDHEIARAKIRASEAEDHLMAHLPPHLVRFMGPIAEADLSKESQEVRDEAASYWESFEVSYPEDAEIIRRSVEGLY
ncbi:hypothetical protein KGQ19_01360 [Catenulispora sp. NL8]|uniref:Uncharacterized protein n=1 Tax=Catenulispora pinistramenti TaxID=2705254 RepID=A0ABS5KGS5_9ACTN|nr:hypothetical protein [Catenulispora pinistramenti]MBS2545508.1 hypothetical protein [Catenulispora pinistramenti]